MNLIALGFALTDALHNPWLHGAALVVLLLCLPRLLGIVYIPHTQVGIIEKIWSSKGSLRAGYSSATPMAHRAKVRAGEAESRD